MREDDWNVTQQRIPVKKASEAIVKNVVSSIFGLFLKHSYVTKNVSLYQMRTKSTQLKIKQSGIKLE